MLLNSQLIQAVRKAWIDDQEHPHRGRDKRAFPDEKHLANILDTAFRASLLNEEGKPIRGSLTLLSPNELTFLEIPRLRESELVMKLEQPRNLDVDVVGKLALATNSKNSSLLIGCLMAH